MEAVADQMLDTMIAEALLSGKIRAEQTIRLVAKGRTLDFSAAAS
jgi:hypothetical protein